MNKTKYGEKKISKARLEKWPNPYSDRDYTIDIDFSEFTCLCPRSGYPDFAKITLTYQPNEKVIELKALKLYINSFMHRYISHENVANEIYDTLFEKLQPKAMKIIADFNPRGNVHTVIEIDSEKA